MHYKLRCEKCLEIWGNAKTQRNGFEVYATNRDGQRVELDVDNITGQVKHSSAKYRDHSYKDYKSESGAGQR